MFLHRSLRQARNWPGTVVGGSMRAEGAELVTWTECKIFLIWIWKYFKSFLSHKYLQRSLALAWVGRQEWNVIDIKVTGTTTLLGLDLKNWFVWIKLAQEHIRKLNTQISASGTRELSLIIIQCIALLGLGCIWPRGLRLRKVGLFPRPSFVTNWSLSLFLF